MKRLVLTRGVAVLLMLATVGSGGRLGATQEIPLPSIAVGGTHSLAVTPEGQVWAWGANHLGQLGTGDTSSHAAPVAVTGLAGPHVTVAAGLAHSLALRADGSVWAWGLNSDGQLGDGTRTRRLAPVLVSPLSDVVAISAGSVHNLALKSDGTVWAWGGNFVGQLGDGTFSGRTRPVRVNTLTNIVAVAAGTGHSLALRADGTVWAWGLNITGQLGDGTLGLRRTPVRVLSVANVVAIAAGAAHSLALSGTGAVWAWGWNAEGQLGDGSRTTRRTPVPALTSTPVSRISAGGAHSLAATTAGELLAWGSNDTGQLGDGTSADRLAPIVVAPPPANVIAVAAGAVHSIALAEDGSAWSWGNNVFGQLGDGSTVTRRRPVPISGIDLAGGLAPPTLWPESGTYGEPLQVTVSTVTPGATIRYTTNGDDPVETDPIVISDESIAIEQSTTVKARAWKGAMTSPVVTGNYVMRVSPVGFAPAGGLYMEPQTVAMGAATPGAEIRYTLDGSEPTTDSELYVAPIAIESSTTITARAFRFGWEPGEIGSGAYTFNFGTLARPVATPPAGLYAAAQSVTLSAGPGATIHYTLDGTEPAEGSPSFTSPIAIAATTTLNARAFRVDYTPSPILTAFYEIDETIGGIPPDPATVAPPVDTTVRTDFASATAFLYSGRDPIQREVAPNALVPERIVVLRGRVRDRDGAAVSGVRISALNQPSLGHTLTRADGMFDFVVNGGGPVTVDYVGDGYLPAQRTVTTQWNDYYWAPDVVLTQLDSQVTVVTLLSDEAQAARGSQITDEDGTRQATLIVPEGGVVANIELQDGTILPAVSRLSIRATEYTVGSNGRAAMPGDLPNASGYTYAVELSADEAFQANATRVTFDRPLAFYVENFLRFPVGGAVPAGYYDRKRAEWVASDNGRIVGIVSITDASADLDIDGDGVADSGAPLTALGVTDGERRRLAALYTPGQSLWRVPIPHFTPWDHNWPYAPPPDAELPNAPPPHVRDHVNNGCTTGGSIIECESQVLGESLPLAGTPYTLNYRSNRQPGKSGAITAKIPLTGATVPASVKRIDLEVSVAGQRFVQTFNPTAGAQATFEWDGRDAYGRTVYGGHTATITVKHIYDAVYTAPAQFERAFGMNGGAAISADESRGEIAFEQATDLTVRVALTPSASVGGWTLNTHHVFDRAAKTIWFGDGSRRDAKIAQYEAKPFGSPAGPINVLVGVLPDGGAVVGTESGLRYQGRHGTSGGFLMTGIPAVCVALQSSRVLAIGAGSNGELYYALTDEPIGAAGSARTLCIGRRKPNGQADNLAIIPLPQAQNGTVARIAIDAGGVIYASAGKFVYQLAPGTQPVLVYTAPITVNGIATTADGSLYIATGAGLGHIYRRTASGDLIHIAGTDTGVCATPRFDGPLDPVAVICPISLTAVGDGSLIFADRDNIGFVVRRLWPDGFVTTIARDTNGIERMVMAPNGEVYASGGGIKRIVEALDPGLTGAPLLSSEDGAQVYDFAASGRHVRTIDSATRINLYTFGYNPLGSLTSVTDRAGLVTTIERDAAGAPSAIVGPYGHRTTLTVNADGYLTSVADPAGGTSAFGYDAGALLTSMTTPRGHIYQFGYDTAGRLVQDDDPAGGRQTLTRTETPTGWTVLLENDLGHARDYTVGETSPGRTTRSILYADATTWSRTELANGWEEVGRDGTRTKVVLAPDPRFGRLAEFPASTTTTMPSGLTRVVTQTRTAQLNNVSDPLSVRRLDEITRVNGRQYSSIFDATARTFTTTTPAGRQSVSTIDTQGRLIRMRTGTLTPVDFTYDAQSRVSAITQGTRVMQHGFASSGELESVTDPLSHTISFLHDAAGRTIRQTRADGEHVDFAHDESGNVVGITPPSRPEHRFVFTPVGQIGRYESPIVGGAAATTWTYTTDRQPAQITRPGGQAVTASYDASGRLTTLTSPNAVLQYAYDSMTGRVRSISAPGSTLTYTFDGSLPVSEEWSGTIAGRVQWTFDASFRMIAETVGGVAIPFQYDLDGLLTGAGALTLGRDAANGFVTSTALGAVTTALTYDTFGAPASRQTTVSGTSELAVTYTRDALGRIERITETEATGSRTDVFTYDSAGRLTGASRDGAQLVSYGYDANGNRVSETTAAGVATAAYDAQDRLVSYGAATYQYSPAGDLQSRSDLAGTTVYSYDAFGNLRSVALPNGTTVEYLVDGANRRIGRRVNGALTHAFLYQDELRPSAEVDADGAVVSRFVYATDINVPEYMVRGGVTYRIVADHRGSPRLVINTSTGAIAQKIDYDPFGRVVVDTNPGFQPFGFAGGLYDPLTGLVRFGARDYDAGTGRWTGRDPIGFAAGDSNLYAYVLNDPINLIDPTGLCEEQNHLKTAADVVSGFADHLTSLLGLLDKSLTERVREELDWDVVNQETEAYLIGELGADVWAALSVASRAKLVARALFRPGGLLNANRYLRVGFGEHGGREVFRISGQLVSKFKKSGHIDLWTGGRIGK